MSMDALTALEATLTMRPKPRYAMSVMLARISSMGMSMLACTACCQAAVSNWRKSSGGGPPALGAAMPKSCRAAKTAACLCPMVMSAATGGTRPPAAALACKAAAPQAATTTFTLHAPAPAHNPGPARPSPLLAPHTSAHLPASIAFALPVPFQPLPVCRSFRSSARHSGPSAQTSPAARVPRKQRSGTRADRSVAATLGAAWRLNQAIDVSTGFEPTQRRGRDAAACKPRHLADVPRHTFGKYGLINAASNRSAMPLITCHCPSRRGNVEIGPRGRGERMLPRFRAAPGSPKTRANPGTEKRDQRRLI